jgi:hypothetical protein
MQGSERFWSLTGCVPGYSFIVSSSRGGRGAASWIMRDGRCLDARAARVARAVRETGEPHHEL